MESVDSNPLAIPNTLENNILLGGDVPMDSPANANGPAISDVVKLARNGSSSPLSNGFSSQLSDGSQGMVENVDDDDDDDDDDEDASGEEDDNQVAKEERPRPIATEDLDGDEDAEGEVDDDATSSTIPLTPEATTPEAEAEGEDDVANNIPFSQQTAVMAKDRIGSGSELTSEDEDPEDDDDDASMDGTSDEDVEDDQANFGIE
jgi:hypothetical protein